MTKLVETGGGILERVIRAIDGFRAKYGLWPDELVLDNDSLDILREHHLTREGYRRLEGFITITTAREIMIACNGVDGKTFDYGKEECSYPNQATSIAGVLGFYD